MARFYFHHIANALSCDNTGTDLPSLREAQVEAVRRLGELLVASAGNWTPAAAWSVFVTDAEQRRVAQFVCTERLDETDGHAQGLRTTGPPPDAPDQG